MAATHSEKSHDYASNNSPFANYRFAGNFAKLFDYSPDDMGFAGRLAEKLYRIANLEKSNKVPKNEAILDTEVDICVITVLWMASRIEKRDSRKNITLAEEPSTTQPGPIIIQKPTTDTYQPRPQLHIQKMQELVEGLQITLGQLLISFQNTVERK